MKRCILFGIKATVSSNLGYAHGKVLFMLEKWVTARSHNHRLN